MYEKLYEIHKKYTQGPYAQKWLELVWTHSNIVLEIALKIADTLETERNIHVDVELLTVGALLHDVGVYQCFDEKFNPEKNARPYLHHGFIGAAIMQKENFPEHFRRFALTHTATGLTKEDVEKAELPYDKVDYIPVSIEEEIICFADKFHSKSPKFSTYEIELEKMIKFDSDRRVKFDNLKRKFGIPDLTEIQKKYSNWHKNFEAWYKEI